MHRLIVTLPLVVACSQHDVSGDPPAKSFDPGGPGWTDSGDSQPDSASADTGLYETGDNDDTSDSAIIDPCADTGLRPTEWVVGAVTDDARTSDPTCSALDTVDWTLTTEWSAALAGFSMNVVIAPNRGSPYASVFVDDWGEMRELDGRDGSVIQTVSIGTWDDDGNTPAVGDATGDGGAEFVTTTWADIHVIETLAGDVTSFPNVWFASGNADEVVALTDIGRDGAFDAVILHGSFALDGTPWVELPDGPGSVGMFVTDLDGDGRSEVLNGEGIWNPEDGTGTAWDPAIDPGHDFFGAAVNVAGSARVILTTGRGILYLCAADGSCTTLVSGMTRGTLPAVGDATGTFRAQPSRDGVHPDLNIDAEIATTADACGDETSILTIDVRNLGSEDAASGATVRVFGSDRTGLTEVASVALTEAIPVGTHVELTLAVARDLLGTMWVVQVDGADGDDCDRVNDRAEGVL